MHIRQLIQRLRLALRPAARFEAVLYFKGPITLWQGAPHPSDVISTKRFHFESFADGWAKTRLRGFDKCDYRVNRIA
jgi:hypothetical protein